MYKITIFLHNSDKFFEESLYLCADFEFESNIYVNRNG